MRIVRTLAAFGLGAIVASAAAAQGIGDKAAQERAKRAQAKGKEAKVFTNTDLDAGRPPGSKPSSDDANAVAAATSSEASAPASSSSPDPYAERREQDKVYVDAVQAAQAQAAAVEARIKELSSKLNPMSMSYIYGSGGSNDANEEQRVRQELREAEEQLTSARQAVQTANQNLQDFRQGRPVGPSEPR
jgi:hypothetical protein